MNTNEKLARHGPLVAKWMLGAAAFWGSVGCGGHKAVVVQEPAPAVVEASVVESAPAAAQAPAGTTEMVVVQGPPRIPAPRVRDVVPPSPGPGYVWVPGYYEWSGGRWVWVSGQYMTPVRPGAVWVPGAWQHVTGGWVWVAGHWQ